MNIQAPLKNRIEAILEFKKEVSEDLIDLSHRQDKLKKKFVKFIEVESPKFNDYPVLLKGEDFYFKQFQINSIEILAGIDEEIKTWSENLK